MTALLLAFLLNALWQLPLLLAATLLCARLLRPWGAAVQHRLWSASLLLQCVVPAASAVAPALPGLPLLTRHTAGHGQVSILLSPAPAFAGAVIPAQIQIAVLVLWAMATLFFSTRFLLGLRTLARLRRSAAPTPLSPEAELAWREATAALRSYPAPTLATSPRVASPVTLGFRRPLVLLPPGLVEELTADELLTLFAHECAHVRRRDFATNLALQALALPLSFHPALAITRARLLEAREWACDAEGARALAGPHPFAASLLRLATRFAPAPGTTQPAHTVGLFTRNTLERRIMHLVQTPTPPSRPGRFARLLASSALVLGTTVTALALHTPADHAPTTATPHARVTPVSGEVMAGHVLTRVAPVYPAAAKAAKVEGAVRLQATISATGSIEHLRVLSGPSELRTSALDSVRQWTYQPFTTNGAAVPVQTTITVTYSLAP